MWVNPFNPTKVHQWFHYLCLKKLHHNNSLQRGSVPETANALVSKWFDNPLFLLHSSFVPLFSA